MPSIHYPLSYNRLKTREVRIGKLKIGSDNPILVQSMLTSPTQDVEACLDEIKSLVAVNCFLIRLTIPSRKDLDAIPLLRKQMEEEGIDASLIADIHFSPSLAIDACELFEKVRINPGNYSDKPKSSKALVDDKEFEEGRERLKELIKPLVDALKKYDSALRIGVNQGSLSTRMMERYGDSPQGMVQSALEMVELFEQQGFDQLVISLKSSNPIVVQKSYRLLVEAMKNRIAIPLHLGVTEAGDGLMGRVKSLSGIGPLLSDGIGDTIRISLTEPSANEILYADEVLPQILPNPERSSAAQENWERPFLNNRVQNQRSSYSEVALGEGMPVKIGCRKGYTFPETGIDIEPDFFYEIKDNEIYFDGHLSPLTFLTEKTSKDKLQKQSYYSAVVTKSPDSVRLIRSFYKSNNGTSLLPVGYLLPDTIGYAAQVQLASMLSEGLLDFLLFPEKLSVSDCLTVFYILQATRSKILTTDYITCPSCGRTLFDIQHTTAEIKKRTSHLKGVKLGVMGCIVNGPGEMADADFGYVGSGEGKIDLYFGQERVRRSIPESEAVDRLIELIKEKGYWKER